jgi:hypothetical protein
MSLKRYSLALLILLMTMLAMVGIANRVVDPFWYFRDVEVQGFNLDKPRFPRNERLVKSALVKKIRPQALILGSSYAEVGFPALHAGFTDGGKLRPYNFALSGAPWPEVYCYTLYALAQPDVQRLVLPVSDTTAHGCSAYPDLGNPDYARLLFSKNAFSASWETLRKQDGKPRVTREGLWYFKRYEEKIRNDADITRNFAEEMRARFCKQPQPERTLDASRLERAAVADDAETAGLRNIVRSALARKVRLVLVHYPKHVLHYELERRCGRSEARWNELRKLAAVVDQEAKGSPLVELWDFHTYRDVSAERVHSGKPMPDRSWQDSGHFNHAVGAIAFDSIFSGGHAYGHKVVLQDFDRLIDETERERREFLQRNPWVREELFELARLAGAAW